MANFTAMTITTKGLELFAAATAGNRLVILGCDATEGMWMGSAAGWASQSRRLSSGLIMRTTEDVTILFADANNIICRAEFGYGTADTADVGTFMLFGKLENAGDDQIFVIGVASNEVGQPHPISKVHLPVEGEAVDNYQALFNFQYNLPDTQAVTASTATFLTYAEWSLWKNRIVTTHKLGIPNEGENQIIFGEKRFENRVVLSGTIFCDNVASFTGETYFSGGIEMQCDISPSVSDTYSIGDLDYRLKSVTAKTLYGENIILMDDEGTGLGEIKKDPYAEGYLYITGANSSGGVSVGNLIVGGTLKTENIEPRNEYCEIGTGDNRYRAISTWYLDAYGIGTDSIRARGLNASISLASSLVPEEDNKVEIGDSTHRLKSVRSDSLDVRFMTVVGGNGNIAGYIRGDTALGMTEYINIGNEYGGVEIEGKLILGEGGIEGLPVVPISNDNITVPVGAMVLLVVQRDSSWTGTLGIMNLSSSTTGDYSIKLGAFTSDGFNANNSKTLAPNQTFRTCGSMVFNNQIVCSVMAVRIS